MTIIVSIVSIGVLIILHEFGHFFFAKKFGVKVEEFGVGLPPRIVGKKWRDTLYSLNLLPIGGFVRLLGEEKKSEDSRSFSQKPVWQRFLIVGGGVSVFWLVAVFLFAVLSATVGVMQAVSDDFQGSAQVQIIGIGSGSPAEKAGISLGDTVINLKSQISPDQNKFDAGQAEFKSVTKVGEVQEFISENKGEEVVITVQRGKEMKDVSLIPRVDPPQGQGSLGVVLARTAFVRHPWYQAPFRGMEITGKLSYEIIRSLGETLTRLITGKGLPPGVELAGPIGVIDLARNSFVLGVSHFFSFLAVLSVYLAIFNTIPIPALDGGRMFFLLLEAVRKKSLPEKIEHKVIAASFGVLILLMIWVTIRDITKLF